MRNRSIVILALVWIIVVVAGVSSAVTLAVSSRSDAVSAENGVYVTQEEYDIIQRYSRLEEVRSILESDYYKELDEDTLLTGAAKGMMDAVGDRYTFYYTPEEMREATEHSEGTYEGVGLLLSADKDGLLTIVRIFKGSPAVEAGLQPYDRITAVNGEAVGASTVKEMDDAISLMRSSDASSLTLTILRDGETLTVPVEKRVVNINRVDYSMLDNEIGYISIYEFMGNDVSGFLEAEEALKNAGAKALVLDLRSNPGGLLDDVVKIADELIPEGRIVYIEDREGKKEEYFADSDYWDIPVAVLINGMSASASEILAGALQDTKRGVVVGETSYGKGIVQTVIPFRSDGAGMQLTTATYYTPSGRSIHGVGITPDEVVVAEDIAGTNQLERAVQLLKKQLGG